MPENFFAMIDRLKGNIRKNTQSPKAMMDAVELGVIRAREDFNKDPVGTTLGSANLGGVGAGLAGFAGITAYHGTPHFFDKFRMDKIGGGAGSQAFGHGLYFADNPDVAKGYRSALAQKDGKSFGLEDGPIMGIAKLIAIKGEAGKIMARKMFPELGDGIEPAIKAAEDAINNSSAFYKVDIPDDKIAKMLQWDKPLTDQPDVVKKAWQKFTSKNPDYLDPSKVGGQYAYPTGKDIYGALFDNSKGSMDQSRVSVTRQLKKQGVPGIRYLDESSTGTGSGSHNTVVFDDRIIKILERNGAPLQGLQGFKNGY